VEKVAKDGYVTRARVVELESRLSKADWRVIEFLATVDYATTGQIERACAEGATPLARARVMRRRLHRLTELQVLFRLERPVGGIGGGSESGVFTLDRAGWRLVELHGGSVPRRVRRPEERGLAFLRHSLAVTDHFVALGERCRELPDAELRGWTGEPASHRRFSYRGRVARLNSDALVEVRRGAELITSFLEVDRGTESLPTLLAKTAGYLRYARLHPRETPQVVFSFSSPQRASLLRERLGSIAGREGLCPELGLRLVSAGGPPEAVAALIGDQEVGP
jgi:Replication-relaxation